MPDQADTMIRRIQCFVTPVKEVDAKQYALTLYQTVMDQIGKSLVFNVCMMGALVGLTGVIGFRAVEKVLEQGLPQTLMEINRQALQLGYDFGAAQQAGLA